jgi:amidohydrolase
MSAAVEVVSEDRELIEWRRHLHRHPELAFHEHRTAAFVADKLREFGLHPITGIAGTGLAVAIEGGKPGPSLGLRAEMDALPMGEESTRPHTSQIPGAAHACGHDGHTVAMLAVARRLARCPPARGRVVILFQPAEETAQGAAAMIRDGLLQRLPLDEIYAFHGMPLLHPGTAMVLTGPTLNGARVWEIEIEGTGGHGAAFYKTVDPLQAAARLAVEIPSIIGRYIDPSESALISVGKLQAGSAPNIIPATALVGGTLRALSKETMSAIYQRLEQICRGVAELPGCTITCKAQLDVPPCINADVQAQAATRACTAILGDNNVVRQSKPLAFTDDFAHFLDTIPGAYVFLGQASPMCHHPAFDFDDALLPVARDIFLALIADRLAEELA